MARSIKRFALLLLILALFAPRVAWAVHVSDHEPLSAASAESMHHHGHSHDSAMHGEAADEDQPDGDKGFVHHHPPTVLMGFTGLLPADTMLDAAPIERPLVQGAVRDGIRLPSRGLPDRPPRTA